MNDIIFLITAVLDLNYRRPHYPCYETWERHVGVASSLKYAEEIIKEFLESNSWSVIHHFKVSEVPVDQLCTAGSSLADFVYDEFGALLDSRTYPNFGDEIGIFHGRTPEQIRFKPGDIVEVQGIDNIHLAFVVNVPPSVERAAQINSGGVFYMDDTDDSYTVMTDENYSSHDHVSPLCLFKPKYKMHPAVERRFRTYYNDYLTSEMRFRIAATTAISRIKEITDEIGVECKVSPYYDEGMLLSFPDYPQQGRTTTIMFYNPRAFDHIDRVRITLQRFFGAKVKGRGYSLHSDGDEDSFSTLK